MSEQSGQAQGVAVTVLPNGHNGALTTGAPYAPSAYHGPGAVGMLAVVLLVLLAAMLAAVIGSPAGRVRALARTWRRPNSSQDTCPPELA